MGVSMRKLILAAVLALGFGLVAAPAAQAQAPAPAAPKHGDIMGLNSSQVVAIGIGLVGGAIVAEAIVGVPVWAGAAAGALIGNWYYAQQLDATTATAVRRAQAMAGEARLYFIGATTSEPAVALLRD